MGRRDPREDIPDYEAPMMFHAYNDFRHCGHHASRQVLRWMSSRMLVKLFQASSL